MGRIGTGTRYRPILERYVVFEGIDGAGTTTQGKMLEKRLQSEGIPVHLTGEPTNSGIGRTIRAILKGEEKAHSSTMPLLFAADRNEHLYGAEGILFWTQKGYWVIGDRYLFSSLAYQTIENSYRVVNQLNFSFPLPQILFFLDVPPETGIERIQNRQYLEIYEKLTFQQDVQKKYRTVVRSFRNSHMQILILDGSRPADTIHDEIWTFFQKFR